MHLGMIIGRCDRPRTYYSACPPCRSYMLGSNCVYHLLYINDMTDCLEKTTPYLYADDTEISSSLVDTLIKNLNYYLNNIRKWLSKNKLKHHPTKSKVMFVGSSRNLNKKVKDNCVLLNNAPISRADTITCLGVDLDEK